MPKTSPIGIVENRKNSDENNGINDFKFYFVLYTVLLNTLECTLRLIFDLETQTKSDGRKGEGGERVWWCEVNLELLNES